jgi:hypothetical protein
MSSSKWDERFLPATVQAIQGQGFPLFGPGKPNNYLYILDDGISSRTMITVSGR